MSRSNLCHEARNATTIITRILDQSGWRARESGGDLMRESKGWRATTRAYSHVAGKGAHTWQGSVSLGEWTLVTCVLAPPFSGFELADAATNFAGWPNAESAIKRRMR